MWDLGRGESVRGEKLQEPPARKRKTKIFDLEPWSWRPKEGKFSYRKVAATGEAGGKGDSKTKDERGDSRSPGEKMTKRPGDHFVQGFRIKHANKLVHWSEGTAIPHGGS